jgi:hypothetical protein
MVPSGQAFHFDYCVDYAVLPKLRIGAAGYYYTQTTGDVVDGRDVGFHGRGFAIGPAIKYDWGRFTFCVINQFEIATINRPEGIRNWIRVWYAFYGNFTFDTICQKFCPFSLRPACGEGEG